MPRSLVPGQHNTSFAISSRNEGVQQECILRSPVIYSKQPNLGITQESLRVVTARVLVVLSGSFTSQIETGPTLT